MNIASLQFNPKMSLLFIRKNLSPVFSIVLILIIITLYFATIHATHFDVRNQCHFTVWAASMPDSWNWASPMPGSGNWASPMPGSGKQLLPGQTWSLDVNTGTYPARIWGRTGCSFDEAGRGKCLTCDCGGLICQSSYQPPCTAAEYRSQQSSIDYLDISLVDGFNLPMEFSPTGGGDCTKGIRCAADINRECPLDLRVPGGCNNACSFFKTDQYCCFSSGPDRCGHTSYSRFFKARCPEAYSYPYDDETSAFTCPSGTNYRVVFCP